MRCVMCETPQAAAGCDGVLVVPNPSQWWLGAGTHPYDALGVGVLLPSIVRADAHRDLDGLDAGHAARQGGRPGWASSTSCLDARPALLGTTANERRSAKL